MHWLRLIGLSSIFISDISPIDSLDPRGIVARISSFSQLSSPLVPLSFLLLSSTLRCNHVPEMTLGLRAYTSSQPHASQSPPLDLIIIIVWLANKVLFLTNKNNNEENSVIKSRKNSTLELERLFWWSCCCWSISDWLDIHSLEAAFTSNLKEIERTRGHQIMFWRQGIIKKTHHHIFFSISGG